MPNTGYYIASLNRKRLNKKSFKINGFLFFIKLNRDIIIKVYKRKWGDLKVKAKSFWVLLLCMLAGLTVGYFVGELCQKVPFLSFMNYYQVFGLEEPVAIDLGVIIAAFKFQIKISLAGILGMVGGIMIYKKI